MAEPTVHAHTPEPTAGADARERRYSDPVDIDTFVEMLQKFERGELTPEAWKHFRVLRGTYGQRQEDGSHMLRIKIPQGILSARQLEALAEVAERFSRGFGHVTTRQNIQLHFVQLSNAEAAMRRLAEDGLTTREACGNSVRNVTACPLAGVAHDEIFDVTPYGDALVRHFLRHPLSSSLPRKFKIAFEGCPEDHAATAIHDIGFRARLRGENGSARRGFSVTVGGGTANLCRSGQLLFEFLPAGELLRGSEAILRVFHRLGDRERRHMNRMKFLIKQLGFEAFKAEVEKAYAEVRAEGIAALPFDPERPPVEGAPAGARPAAPAPAELAKLAASVSTHGPGIHPPVAPALEVGEDQLAAWTRTNVTPQRQPGYVVVHVTLPLGDITSGQLRAVAALARAHGDGTARTTDSQNFVLRWVKREDLRALHAGLAAAGLSLDGAGTVLDVTSCPGAESCRLAVTQSRGLGRLLEDHLRASPALAGLAPDLQIKMSGCPNGCGRHHIAGIGFQGSVRKLDGKAVPQYFVLLGGRVTDAGAEFGRLAAKIPARRAADALDRLLGLYQAEKREGESATDFFARVDVARAKALLKPLEELSAADAKPDDYVDLGETAIYQQQILDGECAA
jgi:sulfite reductase (NADPH) hemoprotein beta-component